MADWTIKRGDTWPPIYGLASDESGMVDLGEADHAMFLAKSGATLIEGTATLYDGGTVLASGGTANWSYTWASGDTDIAGTYTAELEIHWDAGDTQIETVPNSGAGELVIEQDVGDES